jgi:hypothetical protein
VADWRKVVFSVNASVENTAAATHALPLSNTAPKDDRLALGFSILLWAAMLVAALFLVLRYGSDVPSWDDWDMVPTATGHQPVTTKWLWSQHNEHRVPIPRLLQLAMLRSSGIDFRTGMYFNVGATAALALAMILTARRLRGRSSFLDAFFPLALMNWAQADNFLWCWQLEYFVSMCLAGTTLILIARMGIEPKLGAELTAGACIMLLPLCGANGLGMVPPLALWLGYVAVVRWRSPAKGGRRDAIILFAFAAAALLLCGLYFMGYNQVPYHPSTHHPRAILRTALQFLTMSLGPGVVGLSFEERVPMLFWKLACAAVAALLLLTWWMLALNWYKRPNQRLRAAGLFLFIGAMVSLAFGLGMGRNGFEIRYVTLSVPLLCAFYLAWTIYGPPRLRTMIGTLLFTTVIVLLVPNTRWGWRYASDLKSHLAAFEGDVMSGTPPYQLIQRHATYLHPHHLIIMDYMPMLREAGSGVFKRLRDDPPFRDVSLPLTAVELHDMTWDGDVGRATSTDGWVTFELPAEVKAAAIHLRYTYWNAKETAPYLAIHWKPRDQTDFAENAYSKYSPTGDRANWQRGTWSRLEDDSSVVYISVDQPVQALRISLPFEKGTIKVHELCVRVAVDDTRH